MQPIRSFDLLQLGKFLRDRLLWLFRGEVPIGLLKAQGLAVGENFHRERGCIIDINYCWLIEIGDNVTLAPRVHILAHDASMYRHLGFGRIGKIVIGSNVFVGAGSLLLPNITIGDNVVIGAGSVVSKDLPSGVVAAGNPACVICTIDDFIARHAKRIAIGPSLSTGSPMDVVERKALISRMTRGTAYVK